MTRQEKRRTRAFLHRKRTRLIAALGPKPWPVCEGKRLLNPIGERTAILPVSISYKIVKLTRPDSVPAEHKAWMGRSWKYKEVKQIKRVSSGKVPDFMSIKNDTTEYVTRRNSYARLRARGEIL